MILKAFCSTLNSRIGELGNSIFDVTNKAIDNKPNILVGNRNTANYTRHPDHPLKGSKLSVSNEFISSKEGLKMSFGDSENSHTDYGHTKAHQIPHFTNPEFQFPQFKVLQSGFIFYYF